MTRRLLAGTGFLVALVVAAVVAYSAYAALKSPLSTSTNAAQAGESCSPGPCANLSGYVLWVSNVHVDNSLVHMTVKFQNSSGSTHASPDDLQLIDAARQSSTPINDVSGCSTWSRHEFTSKGQTFGPIDICFRVANPTPPFTLKWSPDEGAFCCETDIKIYAS